MFTSYPTYDRYRGLKLREPRMSGEDVYAVQSLVLALGHDPKGLDGVFGPDTSNAVVNCQKSLAIVADGIVGPQTWISAGKKLAPQYSSAFGVPWTLTQGQIEHESSWRGGIYSSPPRADKSYDAGEVQLNTALYKPQMGFNVPEAIEFLTQTTKEYYDLFEGLPRARRWSLAAGAHNAPAYACYYAKQEGATKVKTTQTKKPSTAAAESFREYVADVTIYMVV